MKDLRSKPREVIDAVAQVVSILEKSESLERSGLDFKKMAGQQKTDNFYRIRIGIWRIGIEYIHPRLLLIRILARSDMYKHFPPR